MAGGDDQPQTQLRRNQACLPCRRRRIKCDAAKPHCSSCVRSHQFLKRTQPDEERDAKGIICFYEAHEEESYQGPKKRRQSDSADRPVLEAANSKAGPSSYAAASGEAKVKHLEAKVAELEALLRAQTLYPQPTFTQPMISAMSTPTSSFKTPSSPTRTKQSEAKFQPSQSTIPHPVSWDWGPRVTMKFDAPSYVERDFDGRPIKPTKSYSTPAPSAPWASTSTIPAPYTPPQAASFESSPGEINLTDVLLPGVPLDASVGPNPTPLMQIFYHGYPSNLPSPQLLEHVVHTFFDRVPTISRLFHRATFLARLSLPPTHSNFPAAGTLHAICAVSARYTAAVRTLPVDELIARTGDMPTGKRDSMSPLYRSALNDDFGERHAVFAKEELYGIGGAGGHAIFECCRAGLVLAAYFHQHARWVDGWAIAGMISRMIVPLGLMLDTDNVPDVKIYPFKHSILPPAKNDIEREERSAVFWQTVVLLEMTSASSGWAGSMAMEEVTARLPASFQDFDRGIAPLNPQTHRSPDIFINHPVPDPYVLSIKMFVLLGRCCRFTRQWRNLTPNQRDMMGTDMPEFRALDTNVQGFIMSVPASMRDPVQPSNVRGSKAINADLFGVHVLPHCCTILLHEPFADLADPGDVSARRILLASRAILSFVYLLTGTSVDWSIMLHPVFSYSFFTASRTLVMFLHRALVNGDHTSASVLRSEIEVFRLTFMQFGQNFAMGVRHASMLISLLDACGTTQMQHGSFDDDGNTPHVHPGNGTEAMKRKVFEKNHDILAGNHPDIQFLALAGNSAEVITQALDDKRGFTPRDLNAVPTPQSMDDLATSMQLDADTISNLETFVGNWDWTDGAMTANVRMGQ